MNPKNRQFNQKDKKHKIPPLEIPIGKDIKRSTTQVTPKKQKIRKKRKRNNQSIKNYIKRGLKTLGPVPPP
jgi:hypothetical protein